MVCNLNHLYVSLFHFGLCEDFSYYYMYVARKQPSNTWFFTWYMLTISWRGKMPFAFCVLMVLTVKLYKNLMSSAIIISEPFFTFLAWIYHRPQPWFMIIIIVVMYIIIIVMYIVIIITYCVYYYYCYYVYRYFTIMKFINNL